jgi:hypothetical protein
VVSLRGSSSNRMFQGLVHPVEVDAGGLFPPYFITAALEAHGDTITADMLRD